MRLSVAAIGSLAPSWADLTDATGQVSIPKHLPTIPNEDSFNLVTTPILTSLGIPAVFKHDT